MKKYYFIFFTLLFCAEYASTQTAAEMLSYLKKNITVYYVADPNTADPEFTKVSYETITNNVDNIIFGRKSNNGMDNSSQLLISIFRESVSEPELRKALYYAMQISQRPIDLYLMNDLNGINKEFINNYQFYTVQNSKSKLNYVWPACYSIADAPDAHRAIVMGEQNSVNLQHMKDILCEMVALSELNEYGPIRKYTFIKTSVKTGGPEFIFGFPYNDTRTTTNHAIATAFTLYGSKPLQLVAKRWEVDNNLLLVADPKNLNIPEDKSLRNLVLKNSSKAVGFDLSKVAFDLDPSIVANFRRYDMSQTMDLNPMYLLTVRNDLNLGMIFFSFMERLGPDKFVEALKYNSGRFFVSSPDKKTELLFENLSLVMLNGKTFEDLARSPGFSKQGESFIIALYDLYGPGEALGKQTSFAGDFAATFEKALGATITPGVAENIIPYYLATWQGKIQNLAKQIKVPNGQTYYQYMTDQIARIMGLPEVK